MLELASDNHIPAADKALSMTSAKLTQWPLVECVRHLCQLFKSATYHIIFKGFAEWPWQDCWGCMVLGLMRWSLLLPEGSLHPDIL